MKRLKRMSAALAITSRPKKFDQKKRNINVTRHSVRPYLIVHLEIFYIGRDP